MSFRLVPKSVTLNDLERRNGPYFALFHRIRVRCRRKTITVAVRVRSYVGLHEWFNVGYWGWYSRRCRPNSFVLTVI